MLRNRSSCRKLKIAGREEKRKYDTYIHMATYYVLRTYVVTDVVTCLSQVVVGQGLLFTCLKPMYLRTDSIIFARIQSSFVR
jgi:hypothetical protein